VQDHPTAASLEGFLLGTLAPAEMRAIVAHLAARCERCCLAMEPLASLLLGDPFLEETPEREIPEAELAAYDEAVARSFAAVRERARSLRTSPASPAVAGRALCEGLLARSHALRHEEPEGMVHFARLATLAAESLDPRLFGREAVIDLQARALAELANAYRVADDLESAEATLALAVERSREGSGDPLLLAHVLDLLASLCCHRRRFDRAFALLDAVHAIYRREGEVHPAGRALISKGIYTGYANEPEEAIRLLLAGLEGIDPAREPALPLIACHDLLWLLVDCGRCREARLLLERSRPLYLRHLRQGGNLPRLKLRWLEGRIATGLGELAGAETAFAEVRQGLAGADLGYHSALVGLDLAAVWLRQGKTAQARALVEEMIGAFRALRVTREELAALLLLRETLEREGLTLGLLRSIAEHLGRPERQPGLRFEPESREMV